MKKTFLLVATIVLSFPALAQTSSQTALTVEPMSATPIL